MPETCRFVCFFAGRDFFSCFRFFHFFFLFLFGFCGIVACLYLWIFCCGRSKLKEKKFLLLSFPSACIEYITLAQIAIFRGFHVMETAVGCNYIKAFTCEVLDELRNCESSSGGGVIFKF